MLIGGAIPTWKKELGVPIVGLLQGDDAFLDFLPSPLREQATASIRELAQQVDGFLCHSQFYARQMGERFAIPAEKIFVTPLGIDTSDFVSPPAPADNSRPPTIGYLARLSPEKGLHILVDAFIQLHERKDSLRPRLLIAGWLSPQHREFAEAQFAKLNQQGLSEHFEYRGVVDRVQKRAMLAECDLVSVPAEAPEPKGLYALEAMAAGVAVVLPDNGAFPEMFAAARTGWQFPTGNVTALANVLHQALSDEQQRQDYAAIGRKFVLEQRNADRTAEETIRRLTEIWRSARR
jgi:glycosyltransferase involved in cell wall biosynthesis